MNVRDEICYDVEIKKKPNSLNRVVSGLLFFVGQVYITGLET